MIKIEESVYNHYEDIRDSVCSLNFEEIAMYQLKNGLDFRQRFLDRFFKRLLQTSDLSVTAISQMLGWTDINLFFKYFKYHEETTPTQYRKNTVH